MIDRQSLNIKSQIIKVKEHRSHSKKQKKYLIKQLKGSQLNGHDSSFQVITSIANTMIGSAMIVYPVLFIKDGIFSSLFAMIIVGLLQYSTCRLLLVHNRHDQVNFSSQILRILGPKWAFFNRLVNFILIFFVCSAYFLLIVNNFYAITFVIFPFSFYSKQLATIICMSICYKLLFLKDMDILLNYFKYTIYCVFAFIIFIFISILRQIQSGKVNLSQFKYFSSDFSNVAGTFALSFLIHPIAAPILKRNINQKNNQRDLMIGYILTAFIYFFIGFLGSLTCSSSIKQILADQSGQFSSVFDCVRNKQTKQQFIFFIIAKIVQIGILFQNISVLPILHYLARNQFLDLSQNQDLDKRQKYFKYETYTFITFGLIIALFKIDVSLVLSIDGAIVGFFMAYGIPILTHLKCYHFKMTKTDKKQIKKALLEKQNLNQLNIQLDAISVTTDDSSKTLKKVSKTRCNKHPKSSLLKHLIIYGIILILGLGLCVLKIIDLFK